MAGYVLSRPLHTMPSQCGPCRGAQEQLSDVQRGKEAAAAEVIAAREQAALQAGRLEAELVKARARAEELQLQLQLQQAQQQVCAVCWNLHRLGHPRRGRSPATRRIITVCSPGVMR